MISFKRAFAKAIAEHLGQDALAVEGAIARPPDVKLGLFAYPCFALAKSLRKAPPAIAADSRRSWSRPQAPRSSVRART